MKPRHADDGMLCPLWRKACVKACHTCEFWDHVSGKNPQTGAEMDTWACTLKMQTYLSIENTLAQRQTTASIDRFRDEVQKANDTGMANAMMNLNQNISRAVLATRAVPPQLIGHE